ncbi:NAD-dependent epimerase/dehydratase family protein [Sporosarcina jeotgali]|uniref:NAD-dependent epimerase/dehydratase family protein n=1 Tax=Sporosarcina jeotgali TaxID=3020056 RepID=A0ABZ0KX97_9BACL|nr:NAD-dependent epimerase/dehydratase family protein [Sporosarcina sp. B2O-1]WOV84796.1 NAD-dependent epimerase/dehydratase family protein [Sporosarcina sp. B2O-1]
MKVLITGGYGFIGSHLADRLHKEGDEVFIIDNMSTGMSENVGFRHKGYRMAAGDRECENIFRSEKFDAVVHLAAQVSVRKSVENPRHDAETNIIGLVNMLTLAQKYHVKKFIFASSAAVYGESTQMPLREELGGNPISPYGISKWLGEYYCKQWSDLYGLETVSFRFSNVYGPRQRGEGDGSVIPKFIEKVLSGEPLTVFGDGLQTRDFIFVKDLADAIYRSLCADSFSGVYNLSSETETSILDVIGMLESFQESIEVTFDEPREGDIRSSCLANGKLKNELDWSPIYSMQEGLALTYEAAQKRAAQPVIAARGGKDSKKSAWKRTVPYIENIALFLLLIGLYFSTFDSTGELLTIGAILYITIMGVIYGKRQSIIAASLSVGVLIVGKLAGGGDTVSLLYDSSFFLESVIFLFVGLAVGYAVERKIRVIDDQKKSLTDLEASYRSLKLVFNDMRDVKEELQTRIKNSGDSFGIVHSISKQLDGSEPENVFLSTVSVIQSVMGAKRVSLYRFNENQTYLRLTAQIGQLESGDVKSIRSDEHSYIQSILGGAPLFVNRKLAEGEPMMAAPLRHNGHLFALLVIDDMDADSFSLYHENLFKVAVEMTESALSRAYTLTELKEKTRYVSGTKILQEGAFQEIMASKQLAREKGHLPYLLLECNDVTENPAALATQISPLLRDQDYLYLQENGRMLLLLSSSSEKDGEHVISRLSRNRIGASIVRGEELLWN